MDTDSHDCKQEDRFAAFTLTELLVVIAILALLAATQLPALTRAQAPVSLGQCQNNLRQIAQATMLYRNDWDDTFPTGQRISGAATFGAATGWPRLLLKYMGGYATNTQPMVLVCPNEQALVPTVPFQLHFQGNRYLVSDINDTPTGGVRGSVVRQPAIYWMFMEKGPWDFGNISAGALEQLVLGTWNIPPGSPGYRRHNGGLTAAAADGRVEYLRMPAYQPGRPPPPNLLELGDCSTPPNPGSFGIWIENGPRAKLFCRARPGGVF